MARITTELAKALTETLLDVQRAFPSHSMGVEFVECCALAAIRGQNPQKHLAELVATVSVTGYQRPLSDAERVTLTNQRAAVLIESGWARTKVENAANEM